MLTNPLSIENLGITAEEEAASAQEYFVGHEFSVQNVADLRNAVSSGLKSLGLKPFYADEQIAGHQHILVKSFKKILLSRFSVFDISSLRPNVLLELGIAIGLRKPHIVIARSETDVPDILASIVSVEYASYSFLAEYLCSQAKTFHEQLTEEQYYEVYNRFVHSPINMFSSRDSCLIVDSSEQDSADFRLSIQKSLAVVNISPVFLDTIIDTGQTLDRYYDLVSQSLITIFRLSEASTAELFMFMGIAFTLQSPWLMIAHKGMTIPSNLQGFDRFDYESFLEIEREVGKLVKSYLVQAHAQIPSIALHSAPTMPTTSIEQTEHPPFLPYAGDSETGQRVIIFLEISRLRASRRIELPVDLPVRKLIHYLIHRLDIPIRDEQLQPVAFYLTKKDTGEQIDLDATLNSVEVLSGDSLVLSQQLALRERIRVYILDSTSAKSTTVEMPNDVPMVRLISVLVTKMGLPLGNGSGRPIQYRLHHKESGMSLSDRATLRSAVVMDGDHLSLFPEVTAG